LKLLTENTDRLMLNLENGLVDGILASFEPNFRARDLFSFSDPYFLIGPVLIIPKTSPLNINLELKDKIIGVPANSSSFFDMQGNTSIQLRLYNDILPALKDLDEGRIDGVIFPALTAYIFTSTFYPQHFSIATSPLTQEGLRLIALKNEHGNHLIEQFNAGLLSLKEKGIYTQLLTKWGLIQLDH
jgi:polar amino acid transport system substrate-binding protein